MGQAKRRGTFEQRRQAAIDKTVTKAGFPPVEERKPVALVGRTRRLHALTRAMLSASLAYPVLAAPPNEQWGVEP